MTKTGIILILANWLLLWGILHDNVHWALAPVAAIGLFIFMMLGAAGIMGVMGLIFTAGERAIKWWKNLPDG